MTRSLNQVNRKFRKVFKEYYIWFVPLVVIFYYFFLYVDNTNFKKKLDENIDKYQKEGAKVSKWRLKLAMLTLFAREFFSPYEYRSYDLWGKTKKQRDAYISDEEELNIFSRDTIINTLPRNKFERYSIFSDMFHRDVISIKFDGSDEEQQRYASFAKKHKEAICKPVVGAKGWGVSKISLSDLSLSQLKEQCEGECMLEELIVQGQELAQFHPDSINTIRFVSGLSPEGKFSVLYVLFRNGCGGSVVDNVGAGGLIALADENGIIVTDGMKYGEYYDVHPDTKVRYKGFHIPQWKKLCEIAQNAHRRMPKQRLFGWDFAWTTNGWDLVEVNPCPAFISYQILKGCGIKAQLKEAGLIS